MHLRRALLLFAIVLGLAAIAASVSRPRDGASERATPAQGSSAPADTNPTVSPGSASAGASFARVIFDNAEGKRTRRMQGGEATTVLVEVDEPGQVEIPDLGLSASGDPVTPARFEIFGSAPGTYEVMFTSAAGDESSEVGKLVIEPDQG